MSVFKNMPKTKKKLRVKKHRKIKKHRKENLSKAQAQRGVRALRVKKRKKDSFATENIFDSKIGKTDALFVDNPKETNDALKKFDIAPNDLASPSLSSEQDKKIPWWKKLFR